MYHTSLRDFCEIDNFSRITEIMKRNFNKKYRVVDRKIIHAQRYLSSSLIAVFFVIFDVGPFPELDLKLIVSEK